MSEYLLIGCGYALAAAIQPGPLQAFLLTSVVRNGWRRTLPAAFAPLISDLPVALLTLLVLNRLPSTINWTLQTAGGLFLLYLAWSSYRQWRRQPAAGGKTDSNVSKTFFQAVTVNILNPNPYLGWSLVIGPTLLTAWHANHSFALLFIIAFYAAMIFVTACIVVLFGTTQFLKPSVRHTLVLVSSIILALLGLYQLTAGGLKLLTAVPPVLPPAGPRVPPGGRT